MNPAKKIASLLLLLVLLTTSTGYSTYTILCQMTGGSYSYAFEKHCCCLSTDQHADSAVMCCEEEAEFIQLDVETSVSELQIDLNPVFFVAWIQYQVNQLFPVKDSNTSGYFNYSPPLIERDIPVLVQSFLL